MSNLDEEIERATEDSEEQRRQRLEEINQQQRNDRQQNLRRFAQRQAANKVKGALKKQAAQQAKKIAAQVAKRGFMQLAVATSPYWGSALLIILGALLILFLIISVPAIACSSSYFDGIDVAVLKTMVALIPGDVCGAFQGGQSGGAGATGSWSEGTEGIEVVLTSAYRPGAVVDNNPNRPSAHGRGEAFDVALRNPSVGFKPNPPDPRIPILIDIAQSLGFTGSAGDVVDEYNNPSPGTQGPHIHIEFNDGYCSGSQATRPPNDLVSLVGKVPIQGASDPRVRSCLEDEVIAFFNMALGATYNPPTTGD